MHPCSFFFLSLQSVSYDVKVKSEEAMKTLSTKMTSTFSDSTNFTKEMQQKMTTNNVQSVSPNTITADTSATPADAGTLGKDNAGSTDADTSPTPVPDNNINAGVIAAAVLVPLCLVAMGGFVWYRGKQRESKLEKHVTEMVEQRHHNAMNRNHIHTNEE
jgi:uncharacterized protein YdgA (DUF945 family)